MFAMFTRGRAIRRALFTAALVVGLSSAGTSDAASIINIVSDNSNSTEGLGSFTGSISYASDNAFSTTGLLTITLTNTSNATNGGFITGLLFNVGSADAKASAAYQPSLGDTFSACSGNGLSGQPFGGHFEAGAAIGGSFLGGGNPSGGVGVGETGTFSFLVSASDAGTLDASDFLTGGPFEFDFIVRFRGFRDGGSDKVPAVSTPPNVVPVPAPVALGAVGLVGAMIGSSCLRRKKA